MKTFKLLTIFFALTISTNCVLADERYDKHSIMQKIRESINNKPPNKFITKNVQYEFKDESPIAGKQVMLYHDDSKVWLELTNFEFIIDRRKESDKIVEVYIGIRGNKDKATPYKLDFLDPEATFVFQDKIIRFWDKLPKNTKIDNNTKIIEAIIKGYAALSYHFAFADSLETAEQNLLKIVMGAQDIIEQHTNHEKILYLYNIIHQKYKEEAKSIDRLVTKKDIEENKSIGLTAYYPNPVYLDDIAWYIRPEGMSYREYVEKSKMDLRFDEFFVHCNKEYLSKYSDINYDHCDEYDPILHELYPDMTYVNSTKLCYSDFERKSIYAFRGDGRPPHEVYTHDGFWAVGFKCGNTKDNMFKNKSGWSMEDFGGERYSNFAKCYISTSKIAAVANDYARYTYVISVEGGLSLPYRFGKRHVQDVGIREVAIPGGTGWENVVGVRARDAGNGITTLGIGDKSHFIGPIFLKTDLAETDRENFWKILAIMGGKTQCANTKIIPEIAEACIDFSTTENRETWENASKKCFTYIYHDANLTTEEIPDTSSLDYRIIDKISKKCENILKGAIGLEPNERRERH